MFSKGGLPFVLLEARGWASVESLGSASCVGKRIPSLGTGEGVKEAGKILPACPISNAAISPRRWRCPAGGPAPECLRAAVDPLEGVKSGWKQQAKQGKSGLSGPPWPLWG